MSRGAAGSGNDGKGGRSERRAEPIGLGPALRVAWLGYQRRLNGAMADAGFADRRFPDGRVLRMCRDSAETTISQIGRQLGITRQGASKAVASLRNRGYVTVSASPTSGREKVVSLTPRALEYLAAQRKAARMIENQLRTELGPEGFTNLHRLLEALGTDQGPRMSNDLLKVGRPDSPT
jgi:DNA-binding MarR family transcriptional regulator